jgi:GMP synthase (glutamine-hydrolysing)
VRLLVLDAYPREGREALREAGGTPAGELYARLLRDLLPDGRVDVGRPAEPGPLLPGGGQLADYHGVVWTGSSLSLQGGDDVRVRRQVELARAAFAQGVSSFGSCWAAQVAAVAAGGECAASPRGREFGVARRIRIEPQALGHPLYRDKPPVFDAFTSHGDEVVRLPRRARLLASNAWSRVQALDVSDGRGRFWAVQYHPEYDLAEVAALCRLRREELVAQGTFADARAADDYVASLEALHRDPARADLREALALGPDVLDPALRTRELRNWIDQELRGASASRPVS